MNELPMGFAMALAKNSDAMAHFYRLSEKEKQLVLEQTHKVQSKQEMQDFVSHLKDRIYI